MNDVATQLIPREPSQPGLEDAIEFVNTTGVRRGRPFDDVDTVDRLLGWLVQSGYLAPAAAAAEHTRLGHGSVAGQQAMGVLRAARAGLRDLIDAAVEERTPRPDAVEAVNGVLRLPERAELVTVGERLRVAYLREGAPLDQALASIARAIAAEISEGRRDRFRICDNAECRWAFYDRSRPGSRRWCEMASCGNRMKAARHRARLRGTGGAAPDVG